MIRAGLSEEERARNVASRKWLRSGFYWVVVFLSAALAAVIAALRTENAFFTGMVFIATAAAIVVWDVVQARRLRADSA